MASGFLKWFLGGEKKAKKSTSTSLGLSYELQKLMDLTRNVEDKQPKNEVLNKEKDLLKEVIKLCDEAEDHKKLKIKDFRFDLNRIEKFLKTIQTHEGKLAKVGEKLSELEEDISIKKKEIDDASQVLKYNHSIKDKTEEEIKIAKTKVVSEIEEIKKRIKELVGDVRKKKVEEPEKKPKKKKTKKRKKKEKKEEKLKIIKKVVEKVEEPVVNITTKVVLPEVEKQVETVKQKKKKKQRKDKKFSKDTDKLSNDIVEEALSIGIDKDDEEPVHKEKVETEVDKILALVREKGKVSFSKLQKMLNEKVKTIEEWAEALEEQGFVEIIYPLIGSPYIRLKK